HSANCVSALFHRREGLVYHRDPGDVADVFAVKADCPRVVRIGPQVWVSFGCIERPESIGGGTGDDVTTRIFQGGAGLGPAEVGGVAGAVESEGGQAGRGFGELGATQQSAGGCDERNKDDVARLQAFAGLLLPDQDIEIANVLGQPDRGKLEAVDLFHD